MPPAHSKATVNKTTCLLRLMPIPPFFKTSIQNPSPKLNFFPLKSDGFLDTKTNLC